MTTASGSGTATLNPTQTELTLSFTFTGLPSTLSASHFHNAAAGTGGGVVRSLDVETTDNLDGTGTIAGTWSSSDAEPLDAAMVAELLAGNIYVDIHTPENGGGEIRGQLIAD